MNLWNVPVVPPTIFKFSQISILCQVQDRNIYDVLQSGTFCSCDSVAFCIKIFPNLWRYWRLISRSFHVKTLYISLYLNSVTRRPFISVFICGWLDEKCVFSLGLSHPFYPLPRGAHQHVRPRGHELPHPGVHGDLGVLEEGHCGSAVQGPILYLGLAGQVVCWVNRGHHPVHREKRRQVGRVGGDQDQREEPPDSTWSKQVMSSKWRDGDSSSTTFCLKVDKKFKSLYDEIRLLTDIFFSSPTCYDIRFEAQKYICQWALSARHWTSASLLCGYFSRICVTYFIETHQQW